MLLTTLSSHQKQPITLTSLCYCGMVIGSICSTLTEQLRHNRLRNGLPGTRLGGSYEIQNCRSASLFGRSGHCFNFSAPGEPYRCPDPGGRGHHCRRSKRRPKLEESPMKIIRRATAVLTIFGGFGAALGLTIIGNPIAGGIALIGLCLLGALVAPR